MFDQAGEADEESNDHWTTTTRKVAANGDVSATLSAADARDVYLVEADIDTMTTFSLESPCRTPFTLTVTDYSGDVPKTLANATGADDGRVCVTARVESAACYAEVSFPATKGRASHPAFALTNLSSTVIGYTLYTSGVMSGGDIGFKETSKVVSEGNATNQVMIKVERKHGQKGAATVRVKRTDLAIDTRVWWSDATLTWADGEIGVKEVPLTIAGDASGTYDLSLQFALELVSADAADTSVPGETSRMNVIVRDDDLVGLLAYRNVECIESYALDGWRSGDAVEVRKISGSLPSGLSIAVSGGVLKVSGAPAVLGSSSAKYSVTVKRNGVEVSSGEYEFSYTVRAIDFTNVIPSARTAKTYRNIPIIRDGRMAATLTLGVPASGRLTAKIREASGTTRYAAKAWSAFNEAEGRLSATLASIDAGGGYVEVEFASGEFSLAVFGADGKLLAEAGPFSAEPWSAENPADAWEGQYNVQLPQTNFVDGAFAGRLSGAAYMALRMKGESARRSGTMVYAGVLPNGRAVSGYATLWSNTTNALVAFCSSDDDVASPYAFSGAFTITPRALASSRWLVDSAATTEWSVPDAYGHEGVFSVYGGYYDADEIAAVFAQDFEKDADLFAFAADAAAVFSGRHGEALDMASVAAVMLEGGSPALAPGVPNPQAVSLVFSRETGVVHGTFRLPFANENLAVTYRGISLPGWQACGECTELPERPWALGACSFADRDENGFYRNGCAVGLGRYKEQ